MSLNDFCTKSYNCRKVLLQGQSQDEDASRPMVVQSANTFQKPTMVFSLKLPLH